MQKSEIKNVPNIQLKSLSSGTASVYSPTSSEERNHVKCKESAEKKKLKRKQK